MAEQRKLKTKDKILLEAIKMFNESGVQGITSRHIAAEMGISHGNLDYHYKTKEDMILAIYKKMRKEMSESYGDRKPGVSSMEHFHLLLIQLEDFQYRYRFFNMDVLEISRSYPKTRRLLQKTFELRKQQMFDLFKEFIEDRYLEFPKEIVFERVQHIIRIVITFWLSQREILSTYKFTDKGEMVETVWILIEPYLTETGKTERQRLFQLYGTKSINPVNQTI
jgi:AcrR family transcriptional regulator